MLINSVRTVGVDTFINSLLQVDRGLLPPEILTVLDAFEPAEYPSLLDFVEQGYLSPEEQELIEQELFVHKRSILIVGARSDTLYQVYASLCRVLAERQRLLLLETDQSAMMHLLPRLTYGNIKNMNHRTLSYQSWLTELFKTDADSFAMFYDPLTGLDDFSMAALIDQGLPGVILYPSPYSVNQLHEQWSRDKNSSYVAEQVNFTDMLTLAYTVENEIPGLSITRNGVQVI